jgi:hypothetical protein
MPFGLMGQLQGYQPVLYLPFQQINKPAMLVLWEDVFLELPPSLMSYARRYLASFFFIHLHPSVKFSANCPTGSRPSSPSPIIFDICSLARFSETVVGILLLWKVF